MNKYTLTKAFTLDRDFFNIPRETGTNISLGYVWFNGLPPPHAPSMSGIGGGITGKSVLRNLQAVLRVSEDGILSKA